MRFRRVRRTLIVLSCAALASLVALPTTAGASSTSGKRSALGHFAPYPGGITPMAQSGPITAGSCTYEQATDNAHLSSGDVSTHGWWLYNS
jgi:hypothetical protein